MANPFMNFRDEHTGTEATDSGEEIQVIMTDWDEEKRLPFAILSNGVKSRAVVLISFGKR